MQSMGMEMNEAMDDLDETGRDVEMNVDVRKTGRKKKVAGMDTEEVVITIDGVAEDEETGEVVRSRWIMALWMAKDAKNLSEVEDFNKSMVEKMGFSAGGADQFSSLLSGYADGLKALTKEMEGVEGIPLETHMQIEVEGEEPESKSDTGIDLGGEGGVAGAIGKRLLGGRGKDKEPKTEAESIGGWLPHRDAIDHCRDGVVHQPASRFRVRDSGGVQQGREPQVITGHPDLNPA